MDGFGFGHALHFGQLLLVLFEQFWVGFEELEELLLLARLFVQLGGVFGEGVHYVLNFQYST